VIVLYLEKARTMFSRDEAKDAQPAVAGAHGAPLDEHHAPLAGE